jgi:hypothetical protein
MDIHKSASLFPCILKLFSLGDDWEITQEIKSKAQVTYTSIVDGEAGRYLRIGIDNSGFTQSTSNNFLNKLRDLSDSVVAYANKQELVEMLKVVEKGFYTMDIPQLRMLVRLAPGLLKKAISEE